MAIYYDFINSKDLVHYFRYYALCVTCVCVCVLSKLEYFAYSCDDRSNSAAMLKKFMITVQCIP